MKVLVTGAAGFIGFSLIKRLLSDGDEVVGLDSINSYYDTRLKYARLEEAGILQENIKDGKLTESVKTPHYRFIKLDLADRIGMERLFEGEQFDCVINLGGQAGVRYSIENPYSYVESNVLGFLNVLENCRHHHVSRLLYASSSSIYGESSHVPFSETDVTDSPVSLYAATKKSNELMAYSYCKLYGLSAVGLRFFTVYGPWGRPDMAPYLFMKAITQGRPIKVFNNGDLSRDFTYIDDIVSGMVAILRKESVAAEDGVAHSVYNIGHSSPVKLLDFIEVIEKVTGKKAIKEMVGMQAGDVHCTYADTSKLEHDYGYHPSVSIEEGIKHFYDWFVSYENRR